MRVGWGILLGVSCLLVTADASNWQRKYELQRAPDFLFAKQRPFYQCEGWPPKKPLPSGGYVMISPRAPYRETRQIYLSFTQREVPALTLASDVGAIVMIAGEDRQDWEMKLCAQGDGNTEAEATARMKEVSLSQVGGTISMDVRRSGDGVQGRADMIVHAPADAPVTFHSSYAAIEVYEMSGPVRVTANQARATILQTTGRVDANATVVDYAGSKGTVNLNSASEINLKLTGVRFEGSLIASAPRTVRVLVPQGFATPFEVVVNRRDDFACRTDFCAKVNSEKKNGRYVFTYPGDGGVALVHFNSEGGPVVMDTAD